MHCGENAEKISEQRRENTEETTTIREMRGSTENITENIKSYGGVKPAAASIIRR